ncbi:MAG: septum formation initiator family protein [Lachnospiraceae bacterium]|nr:septum formation initiator family protein [Lachnospiraceae bacterium]
MSNVRQASLNKKKVSAARYTIRLVTFVVAVLLVVLLVLKVSMHSKVVNNMNRAAVLQNQILEEKDRTVEIEELEEYMNSDEYIEQVAKEKLGMVKDGEIIFKEAD